MRKYFKILLGLFRLLKEYLLNFGSLKIHGFKYCICPGTRFWIHNHGVFDLGTKTWISENCIFESSGGSIKLGYNNFFNTNCRVISIEKIIIGNNNLFGPNVVIIDHDHEHSEDEKLICKQGYKREAVVIGSDVWVGSNVTICKGVTICDHVVIGANSVVTKSITEPGVYAGLPAKKIKS